jgi:hypothetical protein
MHALIVRPYCSEDYPIIGEWWKSHGDQELNPMYLSRNGVVISRKTQLGWVPCCASWIYVAANADLAQIGLTVTDPNAPMKIRHEAVKLAINTLKEQASGIGAIITMSSSAGLTRMSESIGFNRVAAHDLLVFHGPKK